MKKKKKLLMVCEAFGGGVFAYVSQLCNDMINEFDVYLAYSIREQTPKNYKEFVDPRVHMIEVNALNIKGFRDSFHIIKTIKELKKIEKEIQPNIIHLHSSLAGGLGRIAYNGKKSKVIYTPHGYAHILLGKNRKSFGYKMIEKILGFTNSITLTCCESENEIAKGLCKKTFYIETGVNLDELSSYLKEIQPVKRDKFTVFTLGRICTQKQPQLFNEIATLVPEAKFVWIGNGDDESLLTAPNIEITGWKSRKEALAMAKGADIFLLCSLGEAIAMSLIENMYMKKLILVSNVMGNKSVIHDNVNGYVCTSAEEYAGRIKDAMKHYPEDLCENAYQDVLNRYNTNVMKKKYIEFYHGL